MSYNQNDDITDGWVPAVAGTTHQFFINLLAYQKSCPVQSLTSVLAIIFGLPLSQNSCRYTEAQLVGHLHPISVNISYLRVTPYNVGKDGEYGMHPLISNLLANTAMKMKWQLLMVGLSSLAIFASLLLSLLHPGYADIPLLIVIITCGTPLAMRILWQVLQRNLGADTLALVAIIAAVVLGEFLAATLIIFMLASGQTLEAYATRKASSALLALAERMPSVAHQKLGLKIHDVALDAVNVGDLIVVYPHEACPVDGVVVEGHGAMDESYLTGEPYVISKSPGATVLSGALNGESMLTVRATKLPADSRYASIVAVLEEAEQKRPSLRRLGDQIGAVFAPVALLFAGVTWYFTGEAVRFLAVIVIATPCPLLIAIPITVISAISMAAKRAIIIKDPTALEKLPTCRTAIFDKTGTLTYGKPTLTETIVAEGIEPDFILQQVASLERYSKHPLAQAVISAAMQANLVLSVVDEVSEKPGQGLRGSIDGHGLHVTHRRYLQNNFPELYAQLPSIVSGLECVVLYDNQYAATLRFRDAPRIESQAFISHLSPSHQFNKIMLVSGDRESEVQYLGKLLNITDIHASQTPEQKVAIARAESLKAPTLFMGDGINDAPAITTATVGVAFGQGSNVAAQAAGVVIMENNLQKLDELFHLSLDTRRIALQSAVGGMLLSLIGMAFAAAGYITPVAGAILQEVIDVLAIMNSLRLVWGQQIKTDIPGFSQQADNGLAD